MQNIGMVKMCKMAFVACVQIFVIEVIRKLLQRKVLGLKDKW